MLDWCRNLQPQQESSTELTLIAAITPTLPHTTKNLLPPKFAALPNTRRLNSENRKGIKTHFSRSFKVDRETQTCLASRTLKDCSTQTADLPIHSLGSKRNSLACSPSSKLEKTHVMKPDNCATERTQLLEISKGTLDYKNERNRETKASYNMLESQEKAFRFEDRSKHEVKNIESYHLSQAAKAKNDTLLSILTPPPHPIMRAPLPHRTQRMAESIRNTITEEHDSNTFSQKYKTMLRNVESEFKLSEKKQSERKIRFTPEKRILFQERETIVSKYGESYQEEKSFRVEESLLYDREIRSLFNTLGRVESHDTFLIFLAVEKTASLLVSIKETSVRQMSSISEELLVYRELEEKQLHVDGLLQLYQTQIDRDSYLFIKEPYTQTLPAYVHTAIDLAPIEAQIASLLLEMERKGLTLKVLPRVQDFVVSFESLKIQNPGIFQFGQEKKIGIEQAVQAVKDQIVDLLL